MTGSPAFINGYLPALLGQAWLVVSSEFHSVVESRGLSVLEWRVLSVLEGNGPTSVSELALKTVSKQPTITRLLHRLEQQGQIFSREYTAEGTLLDAEVEQRDWRLYESYLKTED